LLFDNYGLFKPKTARERETEMRKTGFLAVMLVLMIPVMALGVTIQVPLDQPTIQAGIDAASDGDTVLVASGTYVENISFSGKAITVLGGGADLTVIDGSYLGTVALFNNGERRDSVLDGFTLQNGIGLMVGSYTYGGGISVRYASPTIQNCTIQLNAASWGGGLHVYNSSAAIANCLITNNSTSNDGGGICFSEGSTSIITGCTVNNNSGGWGGGIYVYKCSTEIVDSFIEGNSADLGGGLCFQEVSEATVQGGTISGNFSSNKGGGILCYGASPTITNCTISGNSADNEGGGIHCDQQSAPNISYNTISANIGNGIYLTVSPATITNNTISDNQGGSGCGIYCHRSDAIISDNIITGNAGNGSGGGIRLDQGSPTVSDNIIANNYAGSIGGGITFDAVSPSFINNTISGNTTDGSGGGIYIDNSFSLTIANCTVENNTANLFGGGMYSDCSTFTVTGGSFDNNTASVAGGGIHSSYSPDSVIEDCLITNNIGNGITNSGDQQLTIRNSEISYNSHDFAAGGINTVGPTRMENCLVVGNYGFMNGGGILVGNGLTEIINCTIVENISDNRGGGIFVAGEDTEVIIYNSIFWQNFAPVGPQFFVGEGDSGATVSVLWSDVMDGYEGVYFDPDCLGCGLLWGLSIIDADPLFVGEGDYHLSAGSPCIDTGIDAEVYVDIDGDVRPHGANFDMGFDEFVGSPAEFVLNLDATYATGMLTLNYTIGTPEPVIWNNIIILTIPSISVVPLFAMTLPVVYSPVEVPISFLFPSMGYVGIFSQLLTMDGFAADELAWVYAGP